MRNDDQEQRKRSANPGEPGRERKPADFIKAARKHLWDGDQKQAYAVLLRAIVHHPDNALIQSYFGCLQAIVDRKYRSGIDACSKAISVYRAPDAYSAGIIYPILYLNLGRACLAAGRKEEAIEAFEKGLRYDRSHTELKKEQRLLGIRKRPAVPFLSRENPINKYIGMVLHSSRKSAQPRMICW